MIRKPVAISILMLLGSFIAAVFFSFFFVATDENRPSLIHGCDVISTSDSDILMPPSKSLARR